MEATNCLQILCNDGASVKMKLQLFGTQLTLKKFDNFQHLKERVAANDLSDDKYSVRIKLPSVRMLSSHNLFASD